MSRELYWQIVRDSSCFLVRRNGNDFSSEPNNLLNKNSYKYSSLIGSKSVGVSPASKGSKGAVLTFCSKKAGQNHPSKYAVQVPLRKGRKSSIKTVRSIIGKTYRPDLTCVAACRVEKILESQKPKKSILPKKSRRATKLSTQ